MKKMNNEVIGINITMRPINKDKKWIKFIENLVSINHDKGYAFLYEYYELDGLIHLHERFENLEAYKKHFGFFSAEVADKFLSMFELVTLDVYGEVDMETETNLAKNEVNMEKTGESTNNGYLRIHSAGVGSVTVGNANQNITGWVLAFGRKT